MQVKTYQQRQEVLKKLGFSSYKDYLESHLWKRIRRAAFRLLGSRCSLCGGTANVIHHMTYDELVLLGKDISQLLPLCYICHNKLEIKSDGSKRSLLGSIAVCKIMLGSKRLTTTRRIRRKRN